MMKRCFVALLLGLFPLAARSQDCTKSAMSEAATTDGGQCVAELVQGPDPHSQCLQSQDLEESCPATCKLVADCEGKIEEDAATPAPDDGGDGDGDGDGGDGDGGDGDGGDGDGGDGGGSTGDCFAGDSTVLTDNGPMTIKDVARMPDGVNIMGLNDKGDMVMTDLKLWIHKEQDVKKPFVEFVTKSGHSLKMTSKHLAYVVPCDGSGDREFKFANKVGLDECMLVDVDHKMVPSKVVRINEVEGSGLYAFVTGTNGVIVDGVAASAFAEVENEKIQRLFFTGFSFFLDLLPEGVQHFVQQAFESPLVLIQVASKGFL